VSQRLPSAHFDLAVVGAGILGLASALAAVRRGLKVVVIERDAQANGASVRNFGFITVSGQAPGPMWRRARRTRDVWRELADAAGICVSHSGAWVVVRRPEAVAVIEAFLRTDMGDGCRMLSPAEARSRCPALRAPELAAVLESDVELRVESREAVPRLAAWLAAEHGVTFMLNCSVHEVDAPQLHTSRGTVRAQYVVVCPGDDFGSLYAQRLAPLALTRCKLQMLRLADPGFRLPGTLMSDLGLARYPGYAGLGACAALKTRLAREQPAHLANGIQLIVAQSSDGTLVVGDSHHYAVTPDPFAREDMNQLILGEFRAALGVEPPAVLERWVGTYAYSQAQPVLLDAPQPRVRLALVTSGVGASIGFAVGEELIAGLLAADDLASTTLSGP
jgi:D-hydroxyproline dehydrogenase subunit beta